MQLGSPFLDDEGNFTMDLKVWNAPESYNGEDVNSYFSDSDEENGGNDEGDEEEDDDED